MLEYQKSSAGLGITTQLIDGRKCLAANTAVRSWERIAPQTCEAKKTGGEGGIRTHGDVATTPDFESRKIRHRRHVS